MDLQINSKNYCPLCKHIGNVFYQSTNQIYHQCNNCYGIFVDKNQLLSKDAELLRYQMHNNDIDDKGYQQFVSPITSAILRDYTRNDKGLDFGAGSGPVISKILKDNNYQIEQYDPLFQNYPHLLENQYYYIAACEVIEHFRNPSKEFKLLRSLLLPRGKLFCMTNIYKESIDFQKWDYRSDKTHIFFYHKKTIYWIKEEFGFANATIEGRLITFFN